MPLKRLFAAAILAGAALLCAGAAQAQQTQQGGCAEEDLRCRIAVLERRLDELANRPAPAAAAPAPTRFSLRRICRTNCQQEAVAECRERGFASGRAEDWERDRSGPVTLTRISCTP